MTLLGILVGLTGTFLMVWALTVRRFPQAQQPAFARQGWFRVALPLLSLALFIAGHAAAILNNWIAGGVSLAVTVGLALLALKHDQYSAMAQILFDDYAELKRKNSGAAEFQILYSIAKSRRPLWNEDRIVEFCSGKDVKQLVLLMLLMEYEIHPLNDMKLYEMLKSKVERLAPRT